MALAFQSGESIKQALFEELQNILSPIKEIRTQAESRMKHLEFTEGMCNGVLRSVHHGIMTLDLTNILLCFCRLWRLFSRIYNESIVRFGIAPIVLCDANQIC